MVRCALHIALAIALTFSASMSSADLWTRPIFDDFDDGDYTNNPTWQVGGVPGSTQNVVSWAGSNALHLGIPSATVDYPLTWSGASAVWDQGDMGIYAEMDMTDIGPELLTHDLSSFFLATILNLLFVF